MTDAEKYVKGIFECTYSGRVPQTKSIKVEEFPEPIAIYRFFDGSAFKQTAKGIEYF